MRTIRCKVEKEKSYKVYLKILSAFLPYRLTETELDIMLYIYENRTALTSVIRKEMQKAFNISDKNLNNFISKLTKRGLLQNSEGNDRVINKQFLPPEEENGSINIQVQLNVESKAENKVV